MKTNNDIPFPADGERIGAYMDGTLSHEERIQLELQFEQDPELADMVADDIVVDWDSNIETDFPEFDWTSATPIDAIISEMADDEALVIEDDFADCDIEDSDIDAEDFDGDELDVDEDVDVIPY